MNKLTFNSATLKDLLENINSPENLDTHPWTNSLFVQDFIARNPNPQNRNPGSQLLLAIGELFREMMPPSPPKRAVRLDARWSEFGFLAAKYFSPILFGTPAPASFKDAWERIDASILRFVFGKTESELSSKEIETYALVKNELEITPTSTISDWHRKGLRRLVMIIKSREEYLSSISSGKRSEGKDNKEIATHNSQKSKTRSQKSIKTRKPWFYLTLGTMLFLLFFGANKALRIYQTGLKVYEDIITLQNIVDSPPKVEDIEKVGPFLKPLQDELTTLRNEVKPFIWAAPLFKWVPEYGCEIASAPAFLDFAENLTAASVESYLASQPLISAYKSDEIDLNPYSATQLLVQSHPEFFRAREFMLSASASRENIDTECLSPYVYDMLTKRVDPLYLLMFDSLILATEFPTLVGATVEGPKTYLLLVQNEDELRPTGGFITAAGTVLLQDGNIRSIEFRDSGSLDVWTKPYPAAPWQLKQYMNSSVLVFRDSNWFTNYPTSALYAENLFSYIKSHSVDGVIAINQQLLVAILEKIGPVEVDDVPFPIDASNVISYMRTAKIDDTTILLTDPDPARKPFLKNISAAILEKLFEGSIDWEQLSIALIKALNEHHILVQMDNPYLASVVSRRGWDGTVEPGSGDFLMVVDSNIGFNKTNAVVSTSFIYDVDLTDLENPKSKLVTIHKNDSDKSIPCKQWKGTTLEGQEGYPVDQCYWNYMRVYLAAGTRLEHADPQDIPAEWMIRNEAVPAKVDILQEDIEGVQAFGVLKVVPGGQTVATNLEIGLPASIIEERLDSGEMSYQLRVQKQPGTSEIPITIRVHFSENITFQAIPPEAKIQNTSVLIDTNLREDREIEILFLPE